MPEGPKDEGNVIKGPWLGSELEGPIKTLFERYQNVIDRLNTEITALIKYRDAATTPELEERTNLVEEFEQLLKSAKMWHDRLKDRVHDSKEDMETLESVITHIEKMLKSWDQEKQKQD